MTEYYGYVDKGNGAWIIMTKDPHDALRPYFWSQKLDANDIAFGSEREVYIAYEKALYHCHTSPDHPMTPVTYEELCDIIAMESL